jgi:hypothetical protein
MVGLPRAKPSYFGFFLLEFCLSVGILFPAQTAMGFWGGITIGSTSSESITYGLYTTKASSGSIQWSGPGNSGMLIDSGFNGSNGNANVPALSTPVSLTRNPQSYSQSGLSTINRATSALSTPPTPPFSPSPLNSTNFGTAGTVVSAGTNVIGDNLTPGPLLHIGVAYNSGTFLNSSTSLAANSAAVSFTALHADFMNTGAQLNNVSAGAAISATGTLATVAGQPSYIELADTGTITINGTKTPFFVIAGYVWNGSSLQTFQAGNGSISLSGPDSNGNFSISDNYAIGSFTVPANASLSVDSQLTLVADPGSSITLSGLTGDLPTFGVFGGAVVPEPSSWIPLGTAMLLLVLLWGRRRYPQLSLRLPRLPGVSLVLLVGLTSLILGLEAPGTATAGSITTNDLSLPLRLSSSGFSQFSSSTDSVKETASFDGSYLSAGGFPASGQSATYWVVFQEPDGTQSDSTELIITGLTPTPTANTSVQMFFQGLITTPIGPGPGVFFIPKPVGYFDVATYLRGNNQPGVPTDLSVLVASAVPEPASLVMGGIAVLAELGLALGRRRAI